ncbi:hypothetical protein [Methanolapillus millepedarum]|uniref:Uncharacterized protein n=1 Tax=Methanolapillus millepedarum TaxID=3028296 RepID=A0AA96V2V1_9EURY|nr:hypothetical protein MsAc7_04250 [Methanosarcinaceae archaeon Ac7]
MKFKNITVIVILLVILASAFIIVGVKNENQVKLENEKINYMYLRNIQEVTETYEYSMTTSSTPIYIPEDEMENYSSLIIIGTVKEVLPARWSTDSGLSPTEEDKKSIFPSQHGIYHDIAIEVEEVYKGDLPNKDNNIVYVRQVGGTADGYNLENLDGTDLYKGERVILYLLEDTGGLTKDISPVHYFMYTNEWVFFIIDDDTIIDGNGNKIDEKSDRIPKK